jgi:O-succinylbenzoic acid--CoA ligase
VWKGQAFSYGELDGLVEKAATALREQGVTAGLRVPVRAPSSVEVLVLFHALGRVGAVYMPLNARLTQAEVARSLAQVPREPAKAGIRAALFTSGTTGVPRLVELSDENLRASAAASAKNLGADPEQRWLGTLPLFHVGGLAMAYRCAVYGACLELEPGFDAERVNALFDGRVTHASLVPTTLERLLDARGERPFTGVRAVLIGGGPMTSALLQRARRAGLPVLQTYGLTEATSQVTTERLGEADGTTAGTPLDGLLVRVVDEHGAEVPVGAAGEIQVIGPTVSVPGWLSTKDLGRLDVRGRLTVLSRRVDLIISGGENIYPLEVEAVLREHPAVVDVAVVPKPDEEWGQVPVGFLVLRAELDDAALTAWLRERLAGFKVPREWRRLEALPRNAMGKLERTALVASS